MDRRPPLTRRALTACLATLVVAAGAVVGLLATSGEAPPVAVAPTTTTTTTSTTTTTTTPPLQVRPIELRVPEAPPADAYAVEPERVVGSIEIPRLGLAVPLNQGMSLRTIDRGPSHWPGTALPGEHGNVVIAGHRVTNTRPFHDIHLLQPGDEMILNGEHGRFVYRVTATDVVAPDAMHIVDQTMEPTATIFACHPPGSARYRYVVRFALEGEPIVRS